MPELGTTGLVEYNGIIQDDFLREWRGVEAYKRANEMRLNSPVIAALLLAIEHSVIKVDWTLSSDQGEEDPRLEVWQVFVEHVEGGFQEHIRECLGFLPFGFALFEIVWARYEDYLIPAKLAPRGQDTVFKWLIGENGEIEGFTQCAAPLYRIVDIPIEKLLHYRARMERNNPEGRSILRPSWVSYYYAKNIMQIEGIGIERDLAGMPVITLPPNATTDTKDPNSDASKAMKVVRNIRRDEQEGVVIPNGWDFKLASTGGTRQFDTNTIIGRYESRMLMAALAQFLMLGQQKVGSLALSRDQSDLFTMSVNATADIIRATLESQLLPRMMRLNGYDANGLKLDHSPAGDTDVNALADMLQKLSGFLTWTTQDELWLRQLMNMPQVAEEEIQAERDLKAEQAKAMAERLANSQPVDNKQSTVDGKKDGSQPVDGNVDEQAGETDMEKMNAVALEFFSSRPDATRRRSLERRFQSVWGQVLSRIKGRAVDQAKGLKHVS